MDNLNPWAWLDEINNSPINSIEHDYIPTNVTAFQNVDQNISNEYTSIVSLLPFEFENEINFASGDSPMDPNNLEPVQEVIAHNNYEAAVEVLERTENDEQGAAANVDGNQEKEKSTEECPQDLDNVSDEELAALTTSPTDVDPEPSVQQLYELFGWHEEEIHHEGNAGPPELQRDPRDIPPEERIYRILFILPNGYSSPAFVPGSTRYDDIINYLRSTVLNYEDWENLICELRCLDPPGRNLGKLPKSWTLVKSGLPNRFVVRIILKHV